MVMHFPQKLKVAYHVSPLDKFKQREEGSFEIMKNAKHDEYDTKMKDKTHKWQNWMISNNSNDVSEFIYVIIHNTRARK